MSMSICTLRCYAGVQLRLALPRQTSNYMRTLPSAIRALALLPRSLALGAFEPPQLGPLPGLQWIPPGCSVFWALLACPHYGGVTSSRRIPAPPEAAPAANAGNAAPICSCGITQPRKSRRGPLLQSDRQGMAQAIRAHRANRAEA